MTSDDFDVESRRKFWVGFLRFSWASFIVIAIVLILMAIFLI